MKYTHVYLLELFTEHGLDAGLDRIDIDNVDDRVIRIILQSLHNAKVALFKELESRVVNKKLK